MQKPLSKKLVVFFLAILILGGLFFIRSVSAAEPSEQGVIARFLSYIFFGLLSLFGKLLVAVIGILIQVAQYNDFGNAPAVTKGWIIVRDVCNMFFIAVFINMAFYTVLKWQDYHYSKVFAKIILMAILINFSKGISLFLVDFSQVIMLTFVNAFKEAAAGNFTTRAGLEEILRFRDGAAPGSIGGWDVMLALILGLIMITIYLVTVIAVLLVLITRIITIWLLIVLSPFAYLASVFPKAEKYSGQWWEKFGEQIFKGPVLAFFLWLSLAIVSTNTSTLANSSGFNTNGLAQETLANGQQGPFAATISSISKSDNILSFILMVALLMMALAMTSQMGGMAGTFSQNAMRKLQSAGSGALKAPFKLAGAGLGLAERKVFSKWGVGLDPRRAMTKLKEAWESQKQKDEASGAAKAGASAEEWAARGGRGWGLAAVGRKAMGAHDDFFREYMGWKGVKRFAGVLGGGTDKAREKREESEKLKEDRQLMRTQEEQDKKKTRLEELQKERGDISERAMFLDMKLNVDSVDLSDLKNIDFASGQIKALKEQEKSLREAGRTKEADRIKANAETIGEAINAGGVFNIDTLDSDIAGAFKDGGRALAKSLQGEIEKLDDESKKLKKDVDLADKKKLVFATEGEKTGKVNEISKEINKKEQAAAFYTPPRAVHAAENFRALEAEERKKMPSHPIEATEAVEQIQNAVGSRDKVKFMAWMRKAAEDYNDNEVWNSFGYDGGPEGVTKFRKEIMMGKLGMTDQESMAHISDINYINEQKGHSNVSRMYAVENGVYRERTPIEQAAAVMNEIMKQNSRSYLQNTNRLGYGYETPDGKYRLDKAGLSTIVALQEDMIYRIGRSEMNPHALNKFGEALDQIVALERQGLLTATARDGRFKGLNLRQIIEIHQKESPLKAGVSMKDLQGLAAKL